MSLLEMSLTAGVMIAAVALIRALAMDKLPKKTFLALWAVVLLRLLVPLELPSPVSVYNAVPPQVRGWGAAPAIPMGGLETAPVSQPVNLLPLVWGVGVLALGVFFLVSWVRCRGVFRESLPVEDDFCKSWLTARPLRRRVTLRQSDRVSSPLTYGLLRPVILLPASMDWRDRGRLGYVLSHEFCHIRRLDGLWKLLLTVALCLHWFNPLVWAMYILANRDLELSCDESVVRTCGEDAKAAYAMTLIGMEEKRSMLSPLSNSFSKNAIEERVRAIMGQKKMTVIAVAGAVVIVTVVTAVFATSAAKEKRLAEPDQTPVAQAGALLDQSSKADSGNTATTIVDPGVPGWADEYGLKLDPETNRYYTKKQYDQVAALKTEGYEKQSIAEFNRTLHAALEDYEEYYDSLYWAMEALRMDGGLLADDPLAPFFYYTLRASIDEYDAKLSAVYAGKRAVYSFDAEATRQERADVFGEQVTVGEAWLSYTIEYDILDQDGLTVGERDQFLQSITSGMQTYLDGMDLFTEMREKDEDLAWEKLKQTFQTELDRLGQAASTGHIAYTQGTAENWSAYLEGEWT